MERNAAKDRPVIVIGVLLMGSLIWAIDWTFEALSFTASYMSFEGGAHIFISGLTYGVAGGTRQYGGQTSIPLLLPFGIAVILVAVMVVMSLIHDRKYHSVDSRFSSSSKT